MTLIINSIDYSNFIQQKNDIYETPRRVEGPNGGVSSDDFKDIYDEGRTKYDAEFSLKPMPYSMLRQLAREIQQVPSDVIYTSFLEEEDRAIEARVSMTRVHYLTNAYGQRIYGECNILISER